MSALYSKPMDKIEQVFRRPISDRAKLVVCYLSRMSVMPPVEKLAKALNLTVVNTLEAFQELLNEQIITGKPEKYDLAIQESLIDSLQIAPISGVKPVLTSRNRAPSLVSLLSDWKRLYVQFCSAQVPGDRKDILKLRRICRKYPLKEVQRCMSTFFKDKVFLHYVAHSKAKIVKLEDFERFIDREARSKEIS